MEDAKDGMISYDNPRQERDDVCATDFCVHCEINGDVVEAGGGEPYFLAGVAGPFLLEVEVHGVF